MTFMEIQEFISLILYDIYGYDKEGVAHLCVAANSLSRARADRPIVHADFKDFVSEVNNMIDNGDIKRSPIGLEINRPVPTKKTTSREMYFINKVRGIDIDV